MRQEVMRFRYGSGISWTICKQSAPRFRQITTATPHTHPFNGPFSGTTQVSRYQKGKKIWILLKQETVSGSGISWALCKSAPRSRQITMQHSTTQFFTGRMPFLPPNQQRQSTEGKNSNTPSLNFYRPDALPDSKPTVSKHWRAKLLQH